MKHNTAIEDLEAVFPASTENFGLEAPMDLNVELIYRPTATFFVRVQGDSMIGAGIQSDDILVVDKALKRETAPLSSLYWMESS